MLLCGCKPEIKSSAFRCDNEHPCSDGWFCAADGYCHDRDAGAAIGCADGGECANGWRCGFEGVCHPLAGAGPIACRYGDAQGDLDCTDGWRCGFQNQCVDPAGEKLTDLGGGTGTVTATGSFLPPGTLKGIFAVPQARANAVVVQKADGGGYVFIRRSGSGDRPVITSTAFSGQGVGEQFAVGMNGAWFFRDGGLQWLDGFDGGIVAVKSFANETLGPSEKGPLRVSELRLLPLLIDDFNPRPERAMAFAPDGSGAWLLTGTATSLGEYVGDSYRFLDVVGVPIRPGVSSGGMQANLCAISLVQVAPDRCPCLDMSASPGNVMQVSCRDACWGRYVDGGGSGVQTGEIRLGADGLLAAVQWDIREEQDGINRNETTLKVTDLSSSATACSGMPNAVGNETFEVQCRRPCEDFENLVDFVPVRVGAQLGFDVACERPGGQRVWSRLVPSASSTNENTCQRLELEGASVVYGARTEPSIVGDQRQSTTKLQRPVTPVVMAGGFGRYVNPPGALGANVVAGPDVANASPWVLDQTPTLFFEIPGLGQVALSSSVIGQRATDGQFYANPVLAGSPQSAMAKVEGFALKAITSSRNVMDVNFDQGFPDIRIVGKLNISAADFGEPVHATRVRRSKGDVILVSSKDQLLLGPVMPDGGFTEIAPLLVPSPGSDIISLAELSDGGFSPQVWAATRTDIFRVSENAQGRWQAQPSHLAFPDFVRDVWVTPTGQSRVGTSSGTIYSLPSGLKLAEPGAALKGTAQAYVQYCGQVFMIDEENLYALAPQGDGTGAWALPLFSRPGVLKNGRIFPGTRELWVFGRWGDYWRVPISSCQ
ncbi:MAG: hypothetical protein K1X64_02370 [Myxococcaceae bacterium]|nr:hypothetical protein [Myxococcaceae bacterium]